MELYGKREVTALPNNFPIQQKDTLFCKVKCFMLFFFKKNSLLLIGEVIWQVSDSSFTNELHGKAKKKN